MWECLLCRYAFQFLCDPEVLGRWPFVKVTAVKTRDHKSVYFFLVWARAVGYRIRGILRRGA